MGKTEEQIQKDKEAVQKMIGAKSAMEATQRRIELLEATLKHVDRRIDELHKVYGDNNFIKIYNYTKSDYEVISGRQFLLDLSGNIKKVL